MMGHPVGNCQDFVKAFYEFLVDRRLASDAFRIGYFNWDGASAAVRVQNTSGAAISVSTYDQRDVFRWIPACSKTIQENQAVTVFAAQGFGRHATPDRIWLRLATSEGRVLEEAVPANQYFRWDGAKLAPDDVAAARGLIALHQVMVDELGRPSVRLELP